MNRNEQQFGQQNGGQRRDRNEADRDDNDERQRWASDRNEDWRGGAERFPQGGAGQDRYGQDRYAQDRYAQDRYAQDRYGQGSRYGETGRQTESSGYGQGQGYRTGGAYREEQRYGGDIGGYQGSNDRDDERGNGGLGRGGYPTGAGYGGYQSGVGYGGRGSVSQTRGSYHEDEGMLERMGRKVKEFFGKGPKGYARSDERIKEAVSERLSEGYLDASDIEVTVESGEVTLRGTVRSKQDRRTAEDILEDVLGVKDVTNQLKVKRDDQGSMSTPGSGSSMGSTTTTSTKRNPSS